jgi:hypothetical protein
MFAKIVGSMVFVQKFEFFKTHKNSYMGPLYITYLEYGAYDQQIQSFVQFSPQTGDFW